MKTLHACLIAGVAFSLPFFASAQSPDAKYCSALANKYSGFLAATNQQRSADPQTVKARAGIEQCRAGNTAVGIPFSNWVCTMPVSTCRRVTQRGPSSV